MQVSRARTHCTSSPVASHSDPHKHPAKLGDTSAILGSSRLLHRDRSCGSHLPSQCSEQESLHIMGVFDVLGTNLTGYERVELWITRSALLISFSIIGPTIILIIIDFLLWCFRAGQGPSADLLRRSRSGMDILQQKARRSRSNSRSSVDRASGVSTGLEMSGLKQEKMVHIQGIDESSSAVPSQTDDGTETTSAGITEALESLQDEQRVVDSVDVQASPNSGPQEIESNGSIRTQAADTLQGLNLGRVIE